MSTLAERSPEPEVLDGDISPRELESALGFMKFVNRFWGGVGAVTSFLARTDAPERFTLLDVGTGGGDIPFAIAKWARSQGKTASITAIDVNPGCLAYAAKHHSDPSVIFKKHSAFDIASLGRFDYVVSSMFFHHLSDAEIVSLLRLFRAQAKHFLVNDLLRSPLAHAGAALLASATLNRTVFHDATLSVRRGFTRRDFERYRKEAGLMDARIETPPYFRITLGG
jgi:2-polyprenyl-3-methyl-5-hydroxy-6-metoxy-1,4-benzoquinol methylase